MPRLIRPRWPKRRIARYGLICIGWAAANAAVLVGSRQYELRQLSREFHVPAHLIRRFEARSIQIPQSDPPFPIFLGYRYRPPEFWTAHHGIPLIVFLHGSGDRGSENVQQLGKPLSLMCDKPLMQAYPCAILAPQCPDGLNWASRITAENDFMDVILSMIDAVVQDTRIDPQRVYLVGYSMGGYGAWRLAARAPERFAAAVPIAGGGDPSFAHRLIDVPVWAIHGAEDQVVPVTQSQKMVAAIRASGGHPHYSEVAGLGHQSWGEVFRKDSEVLDWMFQQKRSASLTSPVEQ